MAKEKEMNCLARRKYLNAKGESPEKWSELATDYMQNGYLSDAVDFFNKAEDVNGLENVMTLAVEEGDLFLARRVAKCLSRKIESTQLEDLYQNAERLGKLSFAAQAKAMLNGGDASAGSE